MFQISRYIAKSMYYKQKAEVSIDFMPDMTDEEFLSFLLNRQKTHGEGTIGDFLVGIFNKKLIPRLLELAKIRMNIETRSLKEADIKKLVKTCKHTIVEITETNGFENAQVCAGGVDLAEMDTETFESKMMDGLYITGELLDVDGICGGYNLQWAFTTGAIAGGAVRP